MKICKFSECEAYTMNEQVDFCASHLHAIRKSDRDELKNAGKKRKTIAKVSEKMKGKLKTYKQLRKEYLSTHPYCFANLPGCTKIATQCHHLGGRGTKLNAADTFMAVCFNCHRILHDKLSATERREKGLMI